MPSSARRISRRTMFMWSNVFQTFDSFPVLMA